MPMLNMLGVLTSPAFMDTFSVIRREEVISAQGIGSTQNSAPTSTTGVVYPSNDNQIRRLPDFSIQQKSITVITQYALRGVSEARGKSFQPDLVQWNGDYFQVQVIEDYSNFAAGFILAICSSIDFVDAAPIG